jgi:ribosomal protein S18 acetylase RimI-like enzyme
MSVIKNKLAGSLIIHLNSGRMVFLEPFAKLELKEEDLSSPMLLEFLRDGKIVLLEESASTLNSGSLTIRKGRPTEKDGFIYARHMIQLIPHLARAYGEEAESVIATAYTQPGHVLSFEHVEFAVQEDEVIGTLACFTQEHHIGSVSGGLKKALQSSRGFRYRTSLLIRFLRRFGPETPNDFYLWGLYVEESLRSQRLGSRLLDIAEARAREYGYSRFVLDVKAGNAGAIRFYERRGMALGDARSRFPFMSPGTYRMTKVL